MVEVWKEQVKKSHTKRDRIPNDSKLDISSRETEVSTDKYFQESKFKELRGRF